MSNRFSKFESKREKVLMASVRFLKEDPGDFQAKIKFLLEEGLPVSDLIEVIKRVADSSTMVMFKIQDVPKQNWRMN